MTQELYDYIKKQRDAGVDDLHIKKTLMDAGWRVDLIESALKGKPQEPALNLQRPGMKTLQPSQEFIKEHTQTPTQQEPPEQNQSIDTKDDTQQQAPQTQIQSDQLANSPLAVAQPLSANNQPAKQQEIYPEPVKQQGYATPGDTFVGGTNQEITQSDGTDQQEFTFNPFITIWYSLLYYLQKALPLLSLSLLSGLFISGTAYAVVKFLEQTDPSNAVVVAVLLLTLQIAVFSAVVGFIAPYVYKIVNNTTHLFTDIFKPGFNVWSRIFTATFATSGLAFAFFWILAKILFDDTNALSFIFSLFSLEPGELLLIYGSFFAWFLLYVRYLGFLPFAMVESSTFIEGLKRTFIQTKHSFIATFGVTVVYLWGYELISFLNSKIPADQNFLLELQLDNPYVYISLIIFLLVITYLPLMLAYAYRYKAARAGSKNTNQVSLIINLVLIVAYLSLSAYQINQDVKALRTSNDLFGSTNATSSDQALSFDTSTQFNYTDSELRRDGGKIVAALEQYSANNAGIYPAFLSELSPQYIQQDDLNSSLFNFIYTPKSPDGLVCFDDCRSYELSAYNSNFELIDIN